MSDLIKTLKSSETGDNVYPNIKEDNIPSGAVKTAKLDDESVTTDKLGTMAVTTAKIDTGAVTTAKINDSAITTIKLNDGAVTTAKISDGAVTSAKISDGAVTSAKIGNSAVTNAKINDGAVSYDKLATALKNLIDGKASQTDLETLQTAVNGKQDKIDSTHKLDADLVDDSTSTNKFTNATNLSKLSGIESGAEVNTIETISVNGTPVTPDANRNVNIATGGGGSSVYRHIVRAYIHNTPDFSDLSGLIDFIIYNNSAAQFTTATFETYLINNVENSSDIILCTITDTDVEGNLGIVSAFNCNSYDHTDKAIHFYGVDMSGNLQEFDSNLYYKSVDMDHITQIA